MLPERGSMRCKRGCFVASNEPDAQKPKLAFVTLVEQATYFSKVAQAGGIERSYGEHRSGRAPLWPGSP